MLFQLKLNITQDIDMYSVASANQDEVIQWELEGTGPGPQLDDLRFELERSKKSKWNKAALTSLAELFKEEHWSTPGNWNLPLRTDLYYQDLVEECYGQLRSIWSQGKRKTKDDGTVETVEEVEERLQAMVTENWHNARANGRRLHVSLNY